VQKPCRKIEGIAEDNVEMVTVESIFRIRNFFDMYYFQPVLALAYCSPPIVPSHLGMSKNIPAPPIIFIIIIPFTKIVNNVNNVSFFENLLYFFRIYAIIPLQAVNDSLCLSGIGRNGLDCVKETLE